MPHVSTAAHSDWRGYTTQSIRRTGSALIRVLEWGGVTPASLALWGGACPLAQICRDGKRVALLVIAGLVRSTVGAT